MLQKEKILEVLRHSPNQALLIMHSDITGIYHWLGFKKCLILLTVILYLHILHYIMYTYLGKYINIIDIIL